MVVRIQSNLTARNSHYDLHVLTISAPHMSSSGKAEFKLNRLNSYTSHSVIEMSHSKAFCPAVYNILRIHYRWRHFIFQFWQGPFLMNRITSGTPIANSAVNSSFCCFSIIWHCNTPDCDCGLKHMNKRSMYEILSFWVRHILENTCSSPCSLEVLSL